MPNDLTKQEWFEMLDRQLQRAMPDNAGPSGLATARAQQYLDDGGYENYAADRYPPGKLWAPELIGVPA